LFLFEQLVQRIKAEVRACRELGDSVARLLESRWPHADHVDPALAAAIDQPGPPQHPQMSRNGRQRNAKRPGQIRDWTFSAVCQPDQDPAAGGIGQGREDGCHPPC